MLKRKEKHMSKYCVNTYDYGKHYVWATNKIAALSRVGFRIFGKNCWDYGDIDMWDVTLVESK